MWMGIFTREERAVVFFLAGALAVGSLVMTLGRVAPSAVPDFRERPSEGAPEPEKRVLEEGPVDINSAGAEELVRLPGVGPVRAAAIVSYREANGPFESVDRLIDVKGIGPVTLERLRPLTFAGRADSVPGAPDPLVGLVPGSRGDTHAPRDSTQEVPGTGLP